KASTQQENMSLGPFLQMKNRPFHERTLNLGESISHSREQNIGAPDLVGCEILPIRFQNVRLRKKCRQIWTTPPARQHKTPYTTPSSARKARKIDLILRHAV